MIVNFPGGLNDSRVLTYKRNGDGPGSDTWSLKPPYQNDIEPAIARPGSSPVLRLALDLPEIGDTLAYVLIATPNGITATSEVSGTDGGLRGWVTRLGRPLIIGSSI